MPLIVSSGDKIALQAMDAALDTAFTSGVSDGITTFIALLSGYTGKLTTAQKLQARELMTSAAAAMIAAGISGSGGGGSVTSVGTGNGLSGGPITNSGTIDLNLNASGGLSKVLGAGLNELGIATGGVTNAKLANSSLTVTAGAGLTGGGSISLGGSASLDVGAGTGITVNANDVAVDVTVVATTSNSLVMSNKTLTLPVINGATSASGNFDLSGSSGTFKTTVGAVTLGPGAISVTGNATVATGKTLTLTDITAGSVLFAGTSGVVSQDNSNLFWDDSNNRLGIGTSTVSYLTDIRSTTSVSQVHIGGNSVGDAGGYITVSTSSQIDFSGGAAYNGSSWVAKATTATVVDIASGVISFCNDTGLSIGGTFTPSTRLRVNSDGGILFANSTTAAVSPGSCANIRFSSGNALQVSENTGAYQDVVLLTKTQELASKTLTAQVVKTGLTASGSASNDFSGSTGTFKTSTGAVTIGTGAISVSGIATFSKFVAPNYTGTSTDFQTPTWTAVGYANSYVDYGGAYGGSQYYKDSHGMVHLRIAAKDGTSTATMFTLPAGFRPGVQYIYWAGVDNAAGNILITTGGAVSSTGGNTYCIMGEIVFTAEA